MKFVAKAACLVALSALAASAHSSDNNAHVHGAASLHLVQDGNQVLIELSSPLDNVLGFEHAPRSAAQKQTVQKMTELFDRPASLFTLTAAAQCSAKPARLTSPVLPSGQADGHRDKHDHATRNDVKDTKPDTRVETKSDATEHGQLHAEINFTCLKPDLLKGLTVNLFSAFPDIRRLSVQIAGPRGQSGATLTAAQRQLGW